MRKLSAMMQMLICCSLAAGEVAVAAPKTNSKDPCKPDCSVQCDPLPCPCFEQGDAPIEGMPMTCKYPAAYNHPANIHVDSCWDLYGDISYIYWYAGEEGLDLATPFYNGNTAIVNPNGYTIFQDFDYTSGFKVGLGANLNVDDWVVDLEYTYLRQKTFTSSGTLPLLSGGQTGSFEFEGWFSEKAFGSFGFASSSNFNSSWKLGLDWLDLTFKRPYYQGRRLVITPSAGLRASWIRQNLKITGFNTQIIGLASNNITDISSNRYNSWAIGPRGLLDAHWLVGAGFRFQGNFGASLLFTQFTKISHKETGGLVASSTIPGPYKYKLTNYNCLRPMMEANLGIGWGSYVSDNGYHLDLSATYDFNYLWAQNMLKYAIQLNAPTPSSSINDLMLHGLTLKARFDF